MTVGSDVRTCLANIKNIESTLNTLAMQTTDDDTKKALQSAQQIILQIKYDLNKQLQLLLNEEPQYK
ncbi:MAG TPA: DUF1657 domain-containing protein [Bacillota bacterium]|nr:DUF1657 domain-containing protein [Bacillota bacterium]